LQKDEEGEAMTTSTLENLRRKHFGEPTERHIKGIVIKLLPMPSDWPEVSSWDYDNKDDVFRIQFKTADRVKETRLDDTLLIYCNSNNLINAVEIGKITSGGIESIELQIEKRFELFRKELANRLEESIKRGSEYEELGKFDMNNRVLSFIAESAKERCKKIRKD
jgi:hypothetical protein